MSALTDLKNYSKLLVMKIKKEAVHEKERPKTLYPMYSLSTHSVSHIPDL